MQRPMHSPPLIALDPRRLSEALEAEGKLLRVRREVDPHFDLAAVMDFADGWVHLRPSNTEPIIRLIAEAKTGQRAGELLAEVAVAARLRSTPKSRHT